MARTKNYLVKEVKKRGGVEAIKGILRVFPSLNDVQVRRILINTYNDIIVNKTFFDDVKKSMKIIRIK